MTNRVPTLALLCDCGHSRAKPIANVWLNPDGELERPLWVGGIEIAGVPHLTVPCQTHGFIAVPVATVLAALAKHQKAIEIRFRVPGLERVLGLGQARKGQP